MEAYESQGSTDRRPTAGEVSLAADELTRAGTRVRLLRTILVPEEEICFYLYEAQSIDAVREAALRAGIQIERVSAAAVDTIPNLLGKEDVQ